MEIVLYKPSDTKNSSNARAHAAKIGWQRSAKAAKLKERQRTLNGILPERLAKTTSHGRDSTLRHGTGYLSEDFDSSFAPVLARNVPPSRYGAASLPTIDNSKGIAGAEVAEFLGTFIWPNVGGLVAASQWFQDFCTVPTLYHAQTAASATYRDLMGGSNTWSGNSATFQHRLQAVRLIRATLETYSNLQSKEREQVIFAILILGSHEVKKKDFVEMKSPFFSYFPTASLLHLWARTDPIHAHDNAAFALIEGQGGLDALDSPGLAPMAALVDLLRACSQNLRPRLSCFWKHHVLDMTSSFTDHAGNPATSFPGIGFALLSPKLPASAISVFTEIACLDRVMSTSSSEGVAESELGFLLGVRNATLHRLCCLGPPDRQPVATDVGTTLYEAMKLAALIYCNGVLLAIPPQNRWLARLSTLLQDVLLSGHVRLSDEVCRNAYVWVVFVGGIVSCNAPEAAFFEVLLRNMLPHYGPGWQAMERILSTFIWTDMACKLEAHAFWRRCTLDMANR